MVGQERSIRRLQHATEEYTLIGHGLDPFAPGVQDFHCALDRPEQGPGVDLRDREQIELERGHGSDVAASAAERPEQLGLGVAVGADTPAVGGDHVSRDDAVAGEPEFPDHPTEAAPERVSEHPHVRRRAGEIGETVVAGCNRKWFRQDPRLDARASPSHVDLDPAHPLRLHEQRVPAPVDRARVVAARIERDAQAALCREEDGGCDIVRRLRVDDGDGPLVDREVPGLPRRVPCLVARHHDVACETVA